MFIVTYALYVYCLGVCWVFTYKVNEDTIEGLELCVCVWRGPHQSQEVDWTQRTDITILSDMTCQGYTQGQAHITKPNTHKHSTTCMPSLSLSFSLRHSSPERFYVLWHWQMGLWNYTPLHSELTFRKHELLLWKATCTLPHQTDLNSLFRGIFWGFTCRFFLLST